MLLLESASLVLARQKSGLAAMSATMLKNLERQSSDSFAGRGAAAIGAHINHGTGQLCASAAGSAGKNGKFRKGWWRTANFVRGGGER